MATHNSLSRINIKDVAAAAALSVSTVSRALNNHPDVSEMTRQHVLRVANELGYERNPFAHSLISGKSGLVAIVIYDFDNDYHLQLLRGLNRSARKYHQELLFTFTQSRQESVTTCTSVYRRGVADGAIVFSPVIHDLPRLLALQQAGFPIVVIHPALPVDGLCSIEPADYEGAVLAMQHLINLGHTRIGVIVESDIWGAGPGRLDGYRTALQQAGLTLDQDLVLVGYPGFSESGRLAIRHWLDTGVELSAVLCFNDLVAYGLIHELRTSGIDVPDEVSVIGFDDIPNSQYFDSVGLTTVRQPIADIGAKALEMLVELVRNESEPGAHIVVPMELIVRGTTKQYSG
ncbi:MAG: LacI family DNA-binding transcriptional regulator [Anaerolineae bacterium]|nr:LacI family DNA-binding transcriptional regulator [Anaerolineae bacterium]